MSETNTAAKMLERVRALLAKADSSEFPAEAESFRAKADEIMTAYAIEQWQVDAAQQGTTKRAEPVSVLFEMSWYRTSPHKDHIWNLMQSCAFHCRVKLVYWRYDGKIPAVGLQSDIDYFDMLFTHLMLQMAANLEPKPDPSQPMIENLVRLKESGMKWERIVKLLNDIGQMDDTRITSRLTSMYRAYCKKHNRVQQTTSPATYQRSYATGFVQEIRVRFDVMDRAKEEKGTGMELAIRDIRKVVAEAATEMFGRPRGVGRGVSRNYKTDAAAYRQGTEAGRKADVSSSAGSRLGSTRSQIGS